MKTTLTCILLFFLFLAYYLRISSSLPYHYYDEALWIGKSYFYDLLLHDRNNPLWESAYSYDEPKLAEYVIGAITYPDYKRQKGKNDNYSYISYLSQNNLLCVECMNSFYSYDARFISKDIFDENIYSSAFKNTRSIILRVRTVNAVAAAATVSVIFLLGTWLWGGVYGLLFALVYGGNSLIMQTTLLAHGDGLFLFWYSAAIALMYRFLRKEKFVYALLFGIVSGLAAATKIIGGTLLVPWIIFGGIRLISRKTHKARLAGMLGVACVSMLAIFIALNPYVHHDSLQRLYIMYQHRVAQQQLFQIWYPDDNLASISERVGALATQYFRLDPSPYSALYSFKDYSGGLNMVYGALFFAGIVSFVLKMIYHKKSFHQAFFLIVSGYFIALMMMGWLTVSWARYYTLITWFILATEVEGLWIIIHTVRKQMHHRISRTS